jgi:hypothetical protein
MACVILADSQNFGRLAGREKPYFIQSELAPGRLRIVKQPTPEFLNPAVPDDPI